MSRRVVKLWLVVPGIRLPGEDSGDQRRFAGPAAAVRAGATHIVVGRPITRADRPDLVYNLTCEGIA
jgi:orotidine-5'-phosphate decarboxylase